MSLGVRKFACIASVLVLLVVAIVGCGSQSGVDKTVPETGYFESVRPACVELPNSPNPPCARREQWEIDTYPGVHGYFDSEVLSRLPLQSEDEYRMDWGIGDGFGTPQIIVRGTVVPGSTRCSEARAVVFEADRYQVFEQDLGRIDEVCHIDVQVNEYIVGRGPSTLPVVAGWRNAVSTAVEGYGTATYYRGVAAPIRDSMEGIEFVFDLSISHNLAHADWSFHLHRLWDVQLRPDGTVVGVSWWYGIFGAVAEIGDFEYPLAELQKMMRDAHAKLSTENGGRISDEPDSPMLVTDASRESLLAQLRELGAYDVPGITPAPAPPAPDSGWSLWR